MPIGGHETTKPRKHETTKEDPMGFFVVVSWFRVFVLVPGS